MPLVPAAIYILANFVSFAAFYHDKRAAGRAARRTSERKLLILAFLGPFGAFVSMRIFRHKTQKAKFRLVPLFLCLHIALALLIILH